MCGLARAPGCSSTNNLYTPMRPFTRKGKKPKDAAETALVAAFARLCTVEAARNERKPRSLFDLSTDEPRLSADLFASCVLGEFDGGLPKALAHVVIRACDRDRDGLISKSEFAKAVKISRRGDRRARLALLFDGAKDKDAGELVALARQIVTRGANDKELGDRVALHLKEALSAASKVSRKKFEDACEELGEEDAERAAQACARVLCPAARGDGVVLSVRRRANTFEGSRFPVAPDPETARYRPERAAADRLWRVLRRRSASGAVDAAVVAAALRVQDVTRIFGENDVLHRRDFVDALAPLLKMSSSSSLRGAARRAAFVVPGDARPGSAPLERDVFQSLAAEEKPRAGDARYVISRRWLDDWEAYACIAQPANNAPVTLSFPARTLGFTLGLSSGALVVWSVKHGCAHAHRLRVGASLTHLNATRVACADEAEFASLLKSLKTAPRPLKLTFASGDDATSPRQRRHDRPFTIRNCDLLEPKDEEGAPARLLRHLQQGRDYELLSADAWQALQGWYGADATLERSYVDDGATPFLELYPCFMDIVDGDDETVIQTLQCSLRDPLQRVARKVREAVEAHRTVGHAPVYLLTAQLTDERRVDDDTGRADSPARLEDTLETIVEGEDRAWARVEDAEQQKSPQKSRRRYRFWPSKKDEGEARGLANLGNTCYMNATLQALAAAPPVRTYFALGEYAHDLNTASSCSPQGLLAASFGDLVRSLQEKKGKAVAPHRFRRVVGRYDSTFAGYRQQDAFEFLSKLMEGLGDDLSGRGADEKPYFENPQLVNAQCDVDGVIDPSDPASRVADNIDETEALIAAKCLDHERKRHDHFASYTFLGQTRYELECAKTKESLVCYEQWTALTLPLPHGAPRLDVFCRVSFAANRAWPIDVRVNLASQKKDGPFVISDVLDALAALDDLVEGPKLDRSALIACRVDDDDAALIEAVLNDGDTLDAALRRGAPGVRLVVYEMVDVADAVPARLAGLGRAPSPATSEDLAARNSSEDLEAVVDPDARCVVRISLRALVDANEEDGLYFLSSATPELLGAPFAVRCSRRVSTKALYGVVWDQIRRYLADVPEDVAGRRRYPFLLRRCLVPNEDPVVPPRRDRRCGDIVPEEDADVEIALPDLRDGELFVADLADAARDRFAEGDRVVAYARTHRTRDGEDAGSALRDDADRGRASSLKECFRAALAAQDVQRRSGKTAKDETWRGSRTLCALPPVLVVHLKRFGETGGGRRVKRTARVDFPLDDLELGPFAASSLQDEEACVYDLVATVDHVGGLGGGHYTAACRVTKDGLCTRGDAWLRCDDRCVAALDAAAVVSPAAYVLVYLRRRASPDLIRAALPRRDEDAVDVAALLAGVTKSRRSRSTSARPVKPEEEGPADAPDDDVKKRTLRRRLLNAIGVAKTPPPPPPP